jgi:hypothetical protein
VRVQNLQRRELAVADGGRHCGGGQRSESRHEAPS